VTFTGLEPDAPILPLNKLAAEIKTGSRSGDPVVTAIARAYKATKDMRLLLERDTDPGISDAQPAVALERHLGQAGVQVGVGLGILLRTITKIEEGDCDRSVRTGRPAVIAQ